MAGVKGRSGGPRPNSGGARPGAGRKPKAPVLGPVSDGAEPLAFLLSVQNDASAPLKDRIRAAVAAAQYVHPKMGEGAKKVAAKAAQGVAEEGRFGRRSPPKLVAVGK